MDNVKTKDPKCEYAKIDILRNAFIACDIPFSLDSKNQALRTKGITFSFPNGRYDNNECRFLVTAREERVVLNLTLQAAIFEAGKYFSQGNDVKIEEILPDGGNAILSVFRHKREKEANHENPYVHVFTDVFKRFFGRRG